jgi:hypothetical protein
MNRKKLILSEPLIKIKKELKNKSKIPTLETKLSPREKVLVQQIKDLTSSLNNNNVTRTKAYLDFYNRHPEIHWAFLAHMVSRNGGWNMTDLKGSIMSKLLTKKETTSIFEFLERANWLIFQDAFPQLLVFEESLKKGQNQSYLLQHLNVSTFMQTMWSQFWKERNSFILTVAQIINEQNYLEIRVLDKPVYKNEVFNTLEFKLQDFLSMNHILFPYLNSGKLTLVGQTVHHFEILNKRISIGKSLYSLLFSDIHRLEMAEKWANANSHSGSRKDYWPHIFNDVDEGVPGSILKPKLKSCQLLPGSTCIYSPKLEFAWKNKDHQPAETADWYKNWKVIEYLIDSEEKVDGEIENKYCQTLETLELAANTKKAITQLY